jgi:voltage-gated potassium channel Kch
LALGTIGYAQQPPAAADASPPSLLYYSLQLFTLQAQPLSDPIPPPLNVARFLAPLVAAYTAVTAVAAIFSEQLAAGRIWLLRDQVVICGLGRKGWLLAQAFLERGQRVVVVELNPANPAVELCRDQGGFVLVGDATVPETLRQAGVRQAHHLLAVCGDDAANAEIAASAYGLTRDRPGAPRSRFAPVAIAVPMAVPSSS